MGMADTFGAAFGGGAQIFSAKEQNERARHERQAMNRFTERMSSTAHQRQVTDLRNAGLNPILAATGGSSTPGSSQAPVVNEIGSGVATGLEVMRNKATVKNLEADTMLKNSNSALNVKNLSGASWADEKIKGLKSMWNRYSKISNSSAVDSKQKSKAFDDRKSYRQKGYNFSHDMKKYLRPNNPNWER